MDEKEIALECMKLALTITSPSVDKRDEVIVTTAKMLYSGLQDIVSKHSLTDEPSEENEVKQVRRGRPKVLR